eukprot:gene5155-5805_t
MAENPKDASGRLQLNKPRFNQSTYLGRVKHFFNVTDPRNILATSAQLEAAKRLVEEYKLGKEPSGTKDSQVWHAKKVYDSAYHPETGEKQFIFGRMSAQVPCNMAITGAMLTFYKTAPAVIFWQWTNQTFNALVNYTNRSGDAQITNSMLMQAYISATGCALVTALGLNALVKKLPPLVGRFVPFVAVASGNCVNIPLMRQRELAHGIPIFDHDGNRLGESKIAAKKAIGMTIISRIAMAIPGMCIPPLIMNRLDSKSFMKRMPWLASPIQIMLVGCCLVFATPLCCAIFPQTSSMHLNHLEKELQEAIMKKDLGTIDRVYFNKGL